MLILIEYIEDITIINRQEQWAFDYAAALPAIEDTGSKRDIVHEYPSAALVDKDHSVEPGQSQHPYLALQPPSVDMVDVFIAIISVDRKYGGGFFTDYKGVQVVEGIRIDIEYRSDLMENG